MLKLITSDPDRTPIETLVVPVAEGKEIHDRKAIVALARRATTLAEFKGRADDELVFYQPPELNAARVILLGIGKPEKIDAESFRVFAGRAVKKCIRMGLPGVTIAAPAAGKSGLKASTLLEALMEGAYLGNYRFDAYKQEKQPASLTEIALMVKPAAAREFNGLRARVSAICEGAYLARNWVNLPSNDKRPEVLAESMAALARRENLAVKILNEKDLQRQKFGALLAVAAGSRSKPRLLTLAYTPDNARETVVLAGKGVTFDTGGINLKGTASLAGMKADMSGAAAVAATMITVARHLKPFNNVIGIIPVVENMPSGTAMRPGDIVRSYDGQTIEIGNTDAEGRLILADAMAYAVRRFKPDILIDLATLTGACVVALGEKIAGVFSPDDQLADRIVHAGIRTNERCWRLPLPEDYRPLLKSDIADTKNISASRYGGAITAALFLSKFVRQSRWAHIDIAGPAYNDKNADYCPAGGTGFGVRLLCEILTHL